MSIAEAVLYLLPAVLIFFLNKKDKRISRLEAAVNRYYAACVEAERWLTPLNDSSCDTAAFIREVGQGKIDFTEISDFRADMERKRPVLPLSKALGDVLRERVKLTKEEARRAKRMVSDKPNSRAMAGVCYAMISATAISQRSVYLKHFPWEPADWNPSDRRGNLVRASALILSAIELHDQRGHGETKAAA